MVQSPHAIALSVRCELPPTLASVLDWHAISQSRGGEPPRTDRWP